MVDAAPPKPRFLDRLTVTQKILLVLICLYLFMVGIGAMSEAFKLMGEEGAETLFQDQSPIVSLFIGILATTLVQSSSTTTSTVVTAVAAGGISFDSGIYMVMGANVGTTVTNTIVSLGHITRSNEYKRAFAAATVHDFFNLLVLVILFPLEWSTGFLTGMSEECVDAFRYAHLDSFASPIKLVTRPAYKGIAWLLGQHGVLVLIAGLGLMFGMLVSLVKCLRSLVIHRVENLFDRVLFRTPLVSLVLGIGLTVIVQSSSVTTSLAVPLVGAGLLTIQQVFPYTMGANIGTTFTALLASMGALAAASENGNDADSMRTALVGVTVAFHHVLFNVIGVALVFPFRAVRNLPIRVAEAFAGLALRNRLIPLIYILLTFYLLPLVIVWLGADL